MILAARLTLTWDVLKSAYNELTGGKRMWLTLTWDVLKWWLPRCSGFCKEININMRCIEIYNKSIINLPHIKD